MSGPVRFAENVLRCVNVQLFPRRYVAPTVTSALASMPAVAVIEPDAVVEKPALSATSSVPVTGTGPAANAKGYVYAPRGCPRIRQLVRQAREQLKV